MSSVQVYISSCGGATLLVAAYLVFKWWRASTSKSPTPAKTYFIVGGIFLGGGIGCFLVLTEVKTPPLLAITVSLTLLIMFLLDQARRSKRWQARLPRNH